MFVQVVGKKGVDFKDKASGDQVKGTKIFYTYTELGVDGVVTDAKFLKGIDPAKVEVNTAYRIDYGPTGKVMDFVPA